VDLREVRRVGVDWMHLGWDRDQWWAPVKMIMNNEPLGSIKGRRILSLAE